MKNYIFKLNGTLSLSLFFCLFSQIGLGQNSATTTTPVPVEDCWCKQVVMLPSGAIGVRNIDSLVVNRPKQWSNVKGCDELKCDGKKCTWDYTDGFGSTTEKSGDCESTPFDPDKPIWNLDATGIETTAPAAADCDCIGSEKLGSGMIIFRNISTKKDSFPDNYHFVIECDDACKTKTCKYQKLDPITNEWGKTQKGFCTDKWPTATSAGGNRSSIDEIVVPIETNSAITFYPNPTTKMISIKGEGKINTKIYNLSGQLVLESGQKEINVEALQKGSYIIILNDDSVTVRDTILIQ